jgi:hypothetical protein
MGRLTLPAATAKKNFLARFPFIRKKGSLRLPPNGQQPEASGNLEGFPEAGRFDHGWY